MNVSHKNILIILDAAGCTPLSMQMATELAAGLQAGLQALYIEDNNLLNAVDLPFTREVALHTAVVSSINSTLLRQRLRTDAENIKKQIEKIAVAQSVSLSFSSIRGHRAQAIKNQTKDITMVLIPAIYSISGKKPQPQMKHEVVMLYTDHNPSCDNTLDIALTLAAKKNHQLFILIDSEQSKQHVMQIVGQKDVDVAYQLADFSDLDEIILLLYKHAPSLLVLPENSLPGSNEKLLQQLINSLQSDILLVR